MSDLILSGRDDSPAPPVGDRRAFMLGGAAAAGGLLAAGPADAQSPPATTVSSLYPGSNARLFKLIRQHENAHVAFLTQTIRSLGGTPRPKPNTRNLLMPNVRQFADTSRTFENTGTGGGLGAAPSIFSRMVLAAAGSILQIEARQAGWLNTLVNLLMTQNVFGQEQSFERPLTQTEVVNLVSPFIADLNGGPPPSFSTTPSRANDIAILNFILLLDQVESEFYNLNVPRFFGA